MQLYDHQKAHLQKYAPAEYHGLWWQMGTGKTLSVLLTAVILHQAKRLGGVVVIAPNGVHANWLLEIKKFLPEVRGVAYSSRGSLPQRRAIKDLFENTQGLRLLTMNVEALSYPKSEAVKLVHDFLKTVPSMLVIDESTVIKNPKAMRTKVALKFAPMVKYRRVLTGSPIADNPFDCWAQLEFLKRGITGMNYFQFCHEHGIYEQVFMGTRSFTKVVGYRRLEQLKGLMKKCGTFISKDECLDLPPKVYETYNIELDDAQRKAYALVKNDISMMIAGGYVEPINAMAKLQQLHNIVLGFVKDDLGNITWISDARLSGVVEFLDMVPDKTIVWCSSRPGIAGLATVFSAKWGPGSFVEIHGGVDAKLRPGLVAKFQEDPKCRIFLANQEVAGYGFSLTAASYEIYFRNSYSLEERVQSEDRAHRIGQTKSVTIIDLVAPGTVDEHVLSALQAKLDVAANVVEFLKTVIK